MQWSTLQYEACSRFVGRGHPTAATHTGNDDWSDVSR